jgi:hypothetical protein
MVRTLYLDCSGPGIESPTAATPVEKQAYVPLQRTDYSELTVYVDLSSRISLLNARPKRQSSMPSNSDLINWRWICGARSTTRPRDRHPMSWPVCLYALQLQSVFAYANRRPRFRRDPGFTGGYVPLHSFPIPFGDSKPATGDHKLDLPAIIAISDAFQGMFLFMRVQVRF